MAQKERALPLPLAETHTGNREYFDDIIARLASGMKMPTDSLVFRLTSGGIYEVWDNTEIVVPYVTMTERGIKLHAGVWAAQAGDALLPILRPASEAELLCLGTRRQHTVPHYFVAIGQQTMVRILAHHEDATSVWRQLARHVPTTYLGRRYKIQNELVIVPGRIDTIRLMLDLFIEAGHDLSRSIGNVEEARLQAVKEMAEMAAIELERKLTLPQATARQALLELGQAESDESVLNCIFRAEGALKAEEFHTAVVTEVILNRATTLVRMLHKIQDGTDHAFIALGKLCRDVFRLKEMLMRGEITAQEAVYRAARLGQKARNLYARFIRVCVFKPWREPVFSERGVGLYNAANYLLKIPLNPSKPIALQALNAALRGLLDALSAYEKLVEGEGPKGGEITDIKRWCVDVVGNLAA